MNHPHKGTNTSLQGLWRGTFAPLPTAMTKPSDMLVGPQALFALFSFTAPVFVLQALHPIGGEQSGEKREGGNRSVEESGRQ